MAQLHYEIADGLATVVLNNPPQNRLGIAMLDNLADALDNIGRSGARALLLRADGPDFSFGGDIVPWPDATIAQLRALDRPFVLLDREVQGLDVPAVVSDHAAGMRAAVAHLVDLGHKTIGLIGNNAHTRPSKTRVESVLAACREHRGVSAVVETGSPTAGHGEAAAERLLSRRNAPTAIIATSNETLIGVLRSLRRHEVDVPREMSLLTCDPLPLTEFLQPSLATIDRDHVQMGSTAAELILETLRGRTAGKVTLPVIFDPSDSCGPARAKSIPRPRRVR